jgi:hypothetical protein
MSNADRPLWQVMHDAYWQAAGCEPLPPPPVAPECAAAEIRAIAEAGQVEFSEYFTDGDPVLMKILAWLRDEAERAEAAD